MRYWKPIAVLVGAASLVLPVAHHLASASDEAQGKENGVTTVSNALKPPALAGIDLTRMRVTSDGVTAPAAAGRSADLSLDPGLQTTAQRLFRKRGIPTGAFVMMDLRSGRLLVYASRSHGGKYKDLCADAHAPAASVFKIVTASALVEQAGLNANVKQCYHGGSHGIQHSNLVDDPRRDRWCATLGQAVGRSLNSVIGRLAIKNLDAPRLEATARRFGFGRAMPFDVPVAPTAIEVPQERLEFARTSAGFWHSTLSPLQGMQVAAVIALRGKMIRPVIVNGVRDKEGKLIYHAAAAPKLIRRVIRATTADEVRKMMNNTVPNGTARKQFHDRHGKPFLPGIKVAGKTGTLTSGRLQEYYTWFVGFAPSDKPQVAFSSLVINGPKWRTKAPLYAREMLRAYFAQVGAPGVRAPRVR